MARSFSLDLLNSIRIASPCTADWNSMTGDERKRLCGQCNLHVYNVSAMSADDAAAMIESAEGRMCIRLYKRADGTVITQDCPVGLKLIRQSASRAITRVAAAAALLLAGGLAVATGQRPDRFAKLRDLKPYSSIREWLSPTPPIPAMGSPMIGKMVCPPPTSAAPQTQTTSGAIR